MKRLALSDLSCLPYVPVLITAWVSLSLQPFGIIGASQQSMAEQQHQQQEQNLIYGTTTTTLNQLSSLSSSSSFTQIDSNYTNYNTTLQSPLNSSLVYDNSTYGIKFQFPHGWNKIELLTGRTVNIEFTSPMVNATPVTQLLPAEVVISIERGLGNVTTLTQYGEASDKILHEILGNFTSTEARPAILSGQPAIARVLDIKQPTSGTHINIAQVFTLKDDKAYSISYTAPASRYVIYLPVVQQIINSFQITK